MFATGQTVGVAASGGADSAALLHILAELAPRWKLKLRVLHLNHMLRGEESREDARFVADLAARLGLPVDIREEDVAALAQRSGDNLEQAARRARYGFFASLASSGAVHKVALGHTRSDQAETVLFRLLRGAGTTGLTGIWPVTGDGIVRPLLGLWRREATDFLVSRGLSWREDASNADPRFARNRIRHELLPRLRSEWNPSLDEALANLAELAQAEETYWNRETDRLAGRLLTVKKPAVLLRADRLAGLPEAAGRRLVRRAVALAKGDLRRLGFQHVERVLELARSRFGEGRADLPGLSVVRSFEWLRFGPPQAAPVGYRLPVAAPGVAPIPGSETAIVLELQDKTAGGEEGEEGYNIRRGSVLDVGRIAGTLELRSVRPGDRFWPAGRSGPVKVKDLFHQSRIPSWERPGWPMIVSGGTIVWMRQFGVAEGWAPHEASERVVRLRESDGGEAESKARTKTSD
ncbi:MAG: tRNA lysidine(34) synthetase TilS [Bryobacteraceae bacterium]|nr:tRNA lysidine(34) synthetase TilS [Bryobacteraceae bacterium]